MAGENLQKTIYLPPELTSTRFGLLSADVEIIAAPGVIVPELRLEGEEDAFEHHFEEGRLTVVEKGDEVVLRQTGQGGVTVLSGISASNISISGVRTGGIEGKVVIGGNDVVNSARRMATLLLPELLPGSYLTSHDINTIAGDVKLEEITARILKIACLSGDIALRSLSAETISLETMSGDVEIEDTKSETPVSVKTMSGDIDVMDGWAPRWQLSTMSGDIKVRGAQGEVDASTMSGRARVS